MRKTLRSLIKIDQEIKSRKPASALPFLFFLKKKKDVTVMVYLHPFAQLTNLPEQEILFTPVRFVDSVGKETCFVSWN